MSYSTGHAILRSRQYHERRLSGLCLACEKKAVRAGHCFEHWKKQREYQDKYRARYRPNQLILEKVKL